LLEQSWLMKGPEEVVIDAPCLTPGDGGECCGIKLNVIVFLGDTVGFDVGADVFGAQLKPTLSGCITRSGNACIMIGTELVPDGL
jgi:hypothetical protein